MNYEFAIEMYLRYTYNIFFCVLTFNVENNLMYKDERIIFHNNL